METERRRRRDEASSVPIAVNKAIQAFVPDAGTKVLQARPSETLFVYDWGMRVISTSDENATVWMCLANGTCLTKMLMFGGKTSKATQHLRNKAHGTGSDKIASEVGKKRTREEQLALLQGSPLYRDDPVRAYVLLDKLRIVNSNLPFRIGEYSESLLLRDLMLKEEARVALNAKIIRHAVVELYDATKR